MKVKVFIVTFQNEKFLLDNLESIKNSDIAVFNHDIYVINNYTSRFDLQEYCDKNNVKVLHNHLRPDFSRGHLSRNWNQGIVNGFQDLDSPDCDIVVLAQNDNIFLSDWCSRLVEYHKTYDFITMGGGDQFHSYTPRHVKKVGLWDERFCNIGYQEADYYIRSYLYNRERSSINDHGHKRLHNSIPNDFVICSDGLVGGMRNDEHHLRSLEYHKISRKILNQKWGGVEGNWDEQTLASLPRHSLIPSYVYYPYFEEKVEDLLSKGYQV